MTAELAEHLANSQGKGYVIAPAGFGKTHLIAEAVRKASSCQLVLTHTYAGVNSIRKKMQALKVPASLYHVDTIASWSLHQCLNYPRTSKWKKDRPQDTEWALLYESCAALFDRPFMQKVFRCTYSGIYVDEYQDCNRSQHLLIETLAKFATCRVLGDPMQAIFSFDGKESLISWPDDVYPHFQLLGELKEPWRWNRVGAVELAKWLSDVRTSLERGEQVSLSGPLPRGVVRKKIDINDYKALGRLNHFFSLRDSEETCIAIYPGDTRSKNKAHNLAQSLAGAFSSLEEVEGKDLHSFVKKIESAKTNSARLLLTIDLLKKCCTAVSTVLTAGTKKGEIAKLTKSTRSPEILAAANSFLETGSLQLLGHFFSLVQERAEVSVYRRDLTYRMIHVFRTFVDEKCQTLSEAANVYQRYFRHSGRPVKHGKLIATTLLVKGLEYDHAIVLEADAMSPRDLYVALTRGAKSVTIFTLHGALPP